jgi:hypothetical protein
MAQRRRYRPLAYFWNLGATHQDFAGLPRLRGLFGGEAQKLFRAAGVTEQV